MASQKEFSECIDSLNSTQNCLSKIQLKDENPINEVMLIMQ